MTHVRLGRTLLALAASAFIASQAAAQLPPGSFDPTWGHSGRAFIDLGAPLGFQATASAVQSDGKLVVGGNIADCGGLAFMRLNLDGSLDTSFGTGGWYQLSTSSPCYGEPTTLQAMAAPPYGAEVGFVGRDQGMLLVGSLWTNGPTFATFSRDQAITGFHARAMSRMSSGYGYMVAGYDNREPAGTPGRTTAFVRISGSGGVDYSFGVNGVLKLALGTESDEAAAVTAHWDGSFYFAGKVRGTGAPTGDDMVVGKLRADGALDTAWGSGGTRVIDFNGQDDAAQAITLDYNNRVRVGGSAGFFAARRPVIVQLYADSGALDTGFGMYSGTSMPVLPGNFDADFTTFFNPGSINVAAGTAVDQVTGARSLVVYRFDGFGNPYYGFGSQGLVLAAGHATPTGFFTGDPYSQTFFVAANAAAGTAASVTHYDLAGLDPAFYAGELAPVVTGTQDEGGAMAMRPDGSMVLVGQIRRGSQYTLGGVVSLTASGTRDPSFGTSNGVAYLTPAAGTEQFFPRAVALYQDGRIAVGSTGYGPGGPTSFVARLLPNGSRDPQWNAGRDALLQGAPFIDVKAVAVQADGRVLVAGSISGSVGVARYAADGLLDASFGNNGITTMQLGTAYGLMLQDDGAVVVSANVADATVEGRFAIFRLVPGGQADSTWGIGGVAFGPAGAAFGLARQADGKLVAGGDCGDQACLVRFLAAGQLDPAFGIDGVAKPGPLGNGYNGFIGVAVQADGKIVGGGDSNGFFVSRVRPDGTRDDSFMGGTAYSIDSAWAAGFGMTADGRLVIAGRSLWNGDLAVARHLGGGGDDTPDPFQFTSIDGVAPGSVVASFPVTPTGYDTQAQVTVSNGEVATGDCQSWSSSTYIQPGQLLCVRHTSAAQPGASATSTVSIGGTSATFTSTAAELETTLTSQPSSPAALPVRFWFTSNAPNATFECRLDGSTFGACMSPMTINGLADGVHTFEVRAVSGGAVDPTPASATFTVDGTAPDTTITSGPPASTAAALVSFAFASNDPAATFECSIAGVEFFACVSPKEMGVGEGTWTFAVRAVDAAGNRDPSPAFRTFTIDRTPPDTTVVDGPSGTVGSADASFMYTSNEPGATFECRLDGAAFAACGAASSYSGLAQGAHTFEVRAIDAAGNVDATPATRSWTVDTVPPDTRLLSAPSGTVASTSATLVFDSPDGGSFFMCSLDGAAFASCPSPVNLTGLAQGSHTFRVYVSDAAGNADPTPAIATWIVDTAAPDTLITSAPTGTVASSNATIVFTSEAGASFECRIDGGGFAACTSPQALSGLSQGSHTFEVRARDAVGNTDASPASATWTIDTLAPQTTITSAPSGTLVSTSATVVFSADDPAATFQCQLDAAAYASCTSPVSLTGLADGAHTFAVRALDAAGNVDASAATAAWTVDTTAADAFITSAPSGAVASTAATIAFTSEAGATFECSLDAGAYGTCASPVTLTALAQGSHTFRVRARDAWGNVDASPASATWIVDTVAPDTTITGGPSGNNQPTTVTFTFSATEAGGTFECRLDSGAFVACASGVTYTVAKGQHTLDVRARDAAGNLDATPATRSWRSN